ncbi:hypothetical protein KAFR_0A08660 [Kazachstania africana CBS 2517]|uniref:Uncharacterized protein n=1 Tax=Kazachstania africana (strain ATCC 22294 / BCRC 22015 / CBS 2517 / CECT 1963 / NBRC 1671 / NRRL Y-8276) TaxID=1071382 RepID=H2APK0_KAZAF|nr:hypothetical protein KAFR_0A08660 [Kazachstania africana CBS 2517]CCF56300.1 hypothetical protein KAFR_0A08660 [Kazachstania africana CBS 2517]
MEDPNTATESAYPSMEWPTSLDIPLKASEELVSIDLETDLPDSPSDLRTLLVEENSDKEHWLSIAIAYCNQNKVIEGIQLITMALEVFSQSSQASLHTFLTWAYLKLAKQNEVSNPKLRQENLSNAENHLKEAITLDPTWVGNMLATVELYYQKGHYDKALETSDLFMKSIQAEDRRTGKQSKLNCLFLLMRAKLLYQKKNYTASLKLFQELLVSNPVLRPDSRIGIGLCFWHLKDYNMAIKSWERSLEINNKNNVASILVILGNYHKSLTNSENDEQFKENFTKTLTDLNSLFVDGSHNKENPALLTLLQSYYYFKADYQKVVDIFNTKIGPKKSSTIDSILSESTFWTGRAYYALNDYRRAFSFFQESLKKNEDNLLARFGVGQSQIKTNLVEESILTFENLYKTNENIQELNYVLGLLYSAKCLNHDNATSSSIPNDTDNYISGKEQQKLINKSIQYLEKYIKLTKAKKNQLVVPRAYLVISQLYELQNNYKQSLEYLTDAMSEITFVNEKNVSLEVLNNLACFYFINNDFEKANEYFKKAQERGSNDESLKITLDFNIARTMESIGDINKSRSIYEDISTKHPHYLSAKIRDLYTKFVNDNIDIEDDMLKLQNENKGNLECRAFYSWYLKNQADKDASKETDHNKDTLVKYDSHDLYALISLANLYCTIAKDAKKHPNPKEQEKSKHSYLKAIQLYQKVLQVDPLNVFAAQGIAIVFAESKRLGAALEIFRKVRDSINNFDVHINCGNSLLEMHDYPKAIETYEFVLNKFNNTRDKKAYLLNLLGKAWYSRGMKDKSIGFLQTSLKITKEAIVEETSEENMRKNTKFLNTLKFNIVLLEFQIAEMFRRSHVKDRTVAALKNSINGLDESIKILNEIKDSKDFTIISTEELEQRIQLGETTMKTALERCLTEQKEYETTQNEKLAQALKLKKENEEKERQRIAKEEEEKRLKLEKQKEEYNRLQDEAQKLIQERESAIVNEDEVSDDKEFEGGGDGAKKSDKINKRATNKEAGGEKKKRRKTKKTVGEGRDNEDDDEEEEVKVKSGRGRKSALSSEFIEDSDDELGIESNASDEEEEAKVSDENNDDDDGLF